MPIKSGSTGIVNLYSGSTQIQKVYSGSTEVYSASAPAPTSLSFIASANSTGQTITVPSGGSAPQSGDLLILLDFARSGAAVVPTAVTPTNWNTPANHNVTGGTRTRVMMSWKISDGTEGGTSVTGMNGATNNTKLLAIFRGDHAINSVTVGDPFGAGALGDPTGHTLTSGSGTPPLVCIGGYAWLSAIVSETFSPSPDATLSINSASAAFLDLKYKIYNSSPSDISIAADANSTNYTANLAGYYSVV